MVVVPGMRSRSIRDLRVGELGRGVAAVCWREREGLLAISIHGSSILARTESTLVGLERVFVFMIFCFG